MASIAGLGNLAFSGNTLSVEEAAGLEVALAKRRLEEGVSDVKFWGRITGSERDYLVAYAVVDIEGFPHKRFFACSTGTFDLQQLPELSEEFKAQAAAIKGKFKGDPTNLYGEEEEEEEDEDFDEEEEGAEAKPPKPVKFSELHRLAHVVNCIDHDTAVVPRGAYILTATHATVRNATFGGLTATEAASPSNYFHFRAAEGLEAAAAASKDGLVASTDFLDSIATDSPKGTWVLRVDAGTGSATLRSLAWPGYFFSHTLGTSEFGGAYFGDGFPNEDLAFML